MVKKSQALRLDLRKGQMKRDLVLRKVQMKKGQKRVVAMKKGVMKKRRKGKTMQCHLNGARMETNSLR